MPPSPPLPPEDLTHVIAHTHGLWEELRGQRFFITGGTGFFGRWLPESFARANDELALGASAVVLTRRPEAFKLAAPHRAACSLFAADVRSLASVKPQLQPDSNVARGDLIPDVSERLRCLPVGAFPGRPQ